MKIIRKGIQKNFKINTYIAICTNCAQITEITIEEFNKLPIDGSQCENCNKNRYKNCYENLKYINLRN